MASETTHTEEVASHGADMAHGAAEGAGMPQLDFSTFANQIFWLVVTLVAIYVLLNRVVIPRMKDILEQRRQTIQRDLDRAMELKEEAKAAEAKYQDALARARSEANAIAEKTKADIQADLDAAIAKADAEIAAQSAESATRIAEIQNNAAATVEEVAADTATAIVQQFVPGFKDTKSVAAALKDALKG